MSEPKPMAFPSWELNCQNQPEMTEHGMELRDWFAGLAMQGMLSADTENIAPPLGVVEAAYQYADQMLEARKK